MAHDSLPAVPKIHPATRPMEAEDPLELHGWMVPGDLTVMVRLLVEEYARLGYSAERILQLAADPFYGTFHRLQTLLGLEMFAETVRQTLRRCGSMTAKVDERHPPCQPQIIPLDTLTCNHQPERQSGQEVDVVHPHDCLAEVAAAHASQMSSPGTPESRTRAVVAH